jgi:chromate transport protein ChrA
VRALVISVCWLLIQKMSQVINKGPWISYSQVTCLGLKLVKNPTQTLLIWCFFFFFFFFRLITSAFWFVIWKNAGY